MSKPIHKNDISIATMTWARDPDEENLLRESLIQLSKLELPVFVTDGGSQQSFLDFVRGLPNIKLIDTPVRGVWAQIRNSLKAAYESASPYILYTEPDKLNFFAYSLPGMLATAKLSESSGVVLAARSTEGFASFPKFQQMTETTINNCCAEVIEKHVDYTYGPFLFNARLVPHMEKQKEDLGWGWRPYLFVMAHRLGLAIETYPGDFICPPDQRQDTPVERVYRMRQLYQNILGVVLAAAAPLK